MSDDPYIDPLSGVLANRLGLRDATALERFEREMVTQRIAEGVPHGDFDLSHLKAIHRHLFQDVYEWAGQFRTVEISKDGDHFQMRRYLETGLADVHGRVRKQRYLTGLQPLQFATRAAEIIGDINHAHPFREGNGRTQLQYLKLLADRAGHPLDLVVFDGPAWIAASRAANRGDFSLMAEEITKAIVLER